MSFDYSALITDRTATDVSQSTTKGHYNAEDLNRVTAALDDLKARLNGYGYDVPGYQRIEIDHGTSEYDPYLWYEIDTPTQSQMDQYLNNVQAIRLAFAMLQTTPATPASMELLTWARANDIEQILVDANALLLAMSAAFLRSGMGWAYAGGPGFYFMN